MITAISNKEKIQYLIIFWQPPPKNFCTLDDTALYIFYADRFWVLFLVCFVLGGRHWHTISREKTVLVQISLCVIVYSVRLCSLIGPGLEWLVAGSKSATTEWKSWWAGVQPGVPHSPPWQELHSMLQIISIHELKMMIQAPSGGHPDVLHSPPWQELLTILWMQIHLYRDMSCIYLDCTARGYNTEVC